MCADCVTRQQPAAFSSCYTEPARRNVAEAEKRKEWPVKSSRQSKVSGRLYLFACRLDTMARTLAATHDTSYSRPARLGSHGGGGTGDTSGVTVCGCESIFSSISLRIVPLAGAQEWTSASSMRRSRIFFRSAAIRNRFPTISPEALMTENYVRGN